MSADAAFVPPPLRRFIWDIQSLVELDGGEREILLIGRDLTARLLAEADWAPKTFTAPGAGGAAQYHVYADSMGRFAIVLTALAPGAALAVERPGCWELYGLARGALLRDDSGRWSQPGAVEAAGARGAGTDRLSAGPNEGALAIHVYGGEIAGIVRRRIRPDGGETLLPFANPADAPPFDIFAIQARIED